MSHKATYNTWFTELDALLVDNRRWWQLQPFHHRACCWAASEPELTEALMALSDEQIAELDGDSAQLAEWLGRWVPDVHRLLTLSQLPSVMAEPSASTQKPSVQTKEPSASIQEPSANPQKPPARMEEGIPGRKWQQLLEFVAQVPQGQSQVLEWCAGKGHLGRLLSALQGRKVNSLEWQEKLCSQGEQQAQHWQLPQRFTCADAFAEGSSEQIHRGEQVLALHACGDLHTHLMRRWVGALAQGSVTQSNQARSELEPSLELSLEPSRLSLSPCCYHLIEAEQYQPLSEAAKSSVLCLGRADLQLPLQQSVTAGAHVRRRGEQETLWRLAFDELQRDWRGVDVYLPLPNLKKSLLNGDFANFARWAFEKKSLLELADRCVSLNETSLTSGAFSESNPSSGAFCESNPGSSALADGGSLSEQYLARGAERLKLTRRMELVTHAFRRPLEIWLALDRTLFLSEQGAQVSLSTFCEPELTPRNIFIHAEYPSGT